MRRACVSSHPFFAGQVGRACQLEDVDDGLGLPDMFPTLRATPPTASCSK